MQYFKTVFLKQHISIISHVWYIYFSKQVTIYIDVANSGSRIDLLYGFVDNTAVSGSVYGETAPLTTVWMAILVAPC